MPDKLGFDHLGDEVRCIDCGEGGPIWRWPERTRAQHFRVHAAARRKAAAERMRRTKREATARLKLVTRLRQEARR